MSNTLLDLPCPHCSRINENHSHAEGLERARQDGDVSVCWDCRGIGIYTIGALGTALRKPTEAEATEITASPEIRAVLGALAESYDPLQALSLLDGGAR